MIAGSLHAVGYFAGENLHDPREANPKGFFEDYEVNALNEEMLALVLPQRPSKPILRHLFAHRPAFMQRWVATLLTGAELPPLPSALARRRNALVSHTPFALKDPRFCYTLPYWRDAVGDAAYVCVFREPGRTALSIVNEVTTADYMRSLRFRGVRQALDVWTCMYQHVLDHAAAGGDWLFVHYDQFLEGEASAAIGDLLHVELDNSFADAELKRTPDEIEVPSKTRVVYDELCRRAGMPT